MKGTKMRKNEFIFSKERLNFLQKNTPSMSLFEIHTFLFEDIFSFAGNIRKDELWKNGRFCSSSILENSLEKCLNDFKMHFENFYNDAHFLEMIAIDYCVLNSIHPFLEGNGRTQREFLRQNLAKYGYVLDFSWTKHSDMLKASKNGCIGDYNLMTKIFSKSIHKNDNPYEFYKNLSYLAILSSDDLKLINNF